MPKRERVVFCPPLMVVVRVGPEPAAPPGDLPSVAPENQANQRPPDARLDRSIEQVRPSDPPSCAGVTMSGIPAHESEQGACAAMSLPQSDLRYEWMRNCPQCDRALYKRDPQAPWICECGWVCR